MVPLSSAAMTGPSWPASGFAAAGPDGSLTVTAPQAERVISTVVHAAKNHPCRRRTAKDMVASTVGRPGPSVTAHQGHACSSRSELAGFTQQPPRTNAVEDSACYGPMGG